MSRAAPTSYERRLRSYGLRDASGPTGRTATPAQLRRLKRKNWHRPQTVQQPQPEPVTSVAEPVTEQPEPRRRWTIEDIWRGALRTR